MNTLRQNGTGLPNTKEARHTVCNCCSTTKARKITWARCDCTSSTVATARRYGRGAIMHIGTSGWSGLPVGPITERRGHGTISLTRYLRKWRLSVSKWVGHGPDPDASRSHRASRHQIHEPSITSEWWHATTVVGILPQRYRTGLRNCPFDAVCTYAWCLLQPPDDLPPSCLSSLSYSTSNSSLLHRRIQWRGWHKIMQTSGHQMGPCNRSV